MTGLTLDEALLRRERPNSLNVVRLVLALLVVVSHTWPLGGFGDDPTLGGVKLGTAAVFGFFAISGFLISASRSRLALGAFLRARALRILPAFWVCLFVTAFVIAPVGAALAGETWRVGSATGFVVRNLGLWQGQVAIDRTLLRVPYPMTWNGSLWTLTYEAAAYVAVGVMFLMTSVRRRLRAVTVAMFVGAVSTHVYAVGHVATHLYVWVAELAVYFTAGMLLYAWRKSVPVHVGCALGGGLLVLVGLVTGLTDVVAPLGWAYLVLYAGAVLPARWAQRNDVSYGVYIYAFPVQQLLAVVGIQALGRIAFVLAAVVVTSALAWLSWLFVEKPVLALKPRRYLGVPSTVDRVERKVGDHTRTPSSETR